MAEDAALVVEEGASEERARLDGATEALGELHLAQQQQEESPLVLVVESGKSSTLGRPEASS